MPAAPFSIASPSPSAASPASLFSCDSCLDGFYCKDKACHKCKPADEIAAGGCSVNDIVNCSNRVNTHCKCDHGQYYDYSSEMCHGCDTCDPWQRTIPCTANEDTKCVSWPSTPTEMPVTRAASPPRDTSPDSTSQGTRIPTSTHQAVATNATIDQTTVRITDWHGHPTGKLVPSRTSSTTATKITSQHHPTTDHNVTTSSESSKSLGAVAPIGISLGCIILIIVVILLIFKWKQRWQCPGRTEVKEPSEDEPCTSGENQIQDDDKEEEHESGQSSCNVIQTVVSDPTPMGTPADGVDADEWKETLKLDTSLPKEIGWQPSSYLQSQLAYSKKCQQLPVADEKRKPSVDSGQEIKVGGKTWQVPQRAEVKTSQFNNQPCTSIDQIESSV